MVEKIILHLSINLGFLTQNEIFLADVLILGQTLSSGHLFYFLSYPAIYRETWHAVLKMQKKFSPGTCIFQSPFCRGFFLEWLIFGGAYVRREVCVSQLIGPVYRKFTVFVLFYFVFEGSFPSTSPPPVRGGGVGLYSERRFHGRFFVLPDGGLGGAYFRNFTAVSAWDSNMADLFVNFWDSASNELGKVREETEEENLVPVAKIVKGMGKDSGWGSVKFEEGFPPPSK